MNGKLALIFSFIAGVFAFGYLDINSGILIFVFAMLSILPFILKRYFYMLMAVIFLMGGFLQLGYLSYKSEKAEAYLREKPSEITGVIVDDITRYDNKTYFYLNLDNNIKARIKLEGSISLYPGYIVTISAPNISLVNINNKISTNNTKLLGRDTFLSAEGEELRVTGFNRLYFLQYSGKILREKSSDLMKKHFNSKEASICSAMLSGENFTVESEFYDKLITSGTIHIIVVSGSHFAMLYMMLFLFLTIFIKNRRLKLFIIFPFLIFFVFFTGSTITVIRSFIMSAIVLFADIFYIRRLNTRVAVLIIAAVFMAVTPTLVYSPSFLLSFGAVLGMSLFQNDISRISKINWAWFRDFSSVFLSAQIFTAPIIYYFFARVSKVAFLANICLELAVTFILGLSILFVFAAALNYYFGAVIAFFLSGLLKYFILVVEWTTSIDIWENNGSPYSIVTAMLIISSFITIFFFINLRDKIYRITAALLAGILIISAVVSAFVPMSDKYYITFLGGGETNSGIIRLKDNRAVFYGSVEDLYYYKTEITSGTEIPLMIITEVSDEVKLKELLDIYRVKNIVAAKSLEPSLHWLKHVKFMEKKSYKTTLMDLDINIISDGKYFKEVIFRYGKSVISFANDNDFIKESDKTVILNPKINLEKNFNETIVLLSKKYYNDISVRAYSNFSILEISKSGTVVK